MAEVYLRQHQPLLLLPLLLLLHRHALLQPAGEDLLGLDSEFVEFAVGTDCANQQRQGLLVLLQFAFQREVFVFDLLDLLLDLLDIDRSLLERGRPLHVASVDRFLIRQGAPPLFPHVRRLPVMLPAFLDLLSVVAPFSLEGLLLPHFQRPLPLAGLLLALFELGLQIGLLGEVEEGDVADALLVQILLAVGEDVGVEVLGGKYVIIGWQDGHEGDVAVEEAGLGVGPVFGEGGVESAVVVVLVGVGQGGLVVVAHAGVLHEGGVVAAQLLLPVLQTAVVAADFFLLLLDPALLLQPLLLLLPPVLLRLPVQLLLQLSPLAFLLHLLVVVELLREQSSVVAALLQLSGLLFVEHYYYVGCPIFPRTAPSIHKWGLAVGGWWVYIFVIMGGHGGLNILPQKKWNVYNWDNREIVEKDKKLHAQKQRKEYEAEREQALDNKISVLKGDIPTEEVEGRPLKEEKKVHSLISMEMRRIADQEKHINLFQEEERILMNRELAEVKRLKEEEFLKDKNMDFSSKFLGTYTEERNMPWYSKKKGAVQEKRRNRHYRALDDVIEGAKSDSRVTKQIIEVEKKQERKAKEEHQRDRTREKFYSKYEDYEDRYARVEKVESRISKDLMKHEEEQLLRQFQEEKRAEVGRLRAKRVQREERERAREEELRRRAGSDGV